MVCFYFVFVVLFFVLKVVKDSSLKTYHTFNVLANNLRIYEGAAEKAQSLRDHSALGKNQNLVANIRVR